MTEWLFHRSTVHLETRTDRDLLLALAPVAPEPIAGAQKPTLVGASLEPAAPSTVIVKLWILSPPRSQTANASKMFVISQNEKTDAASSLGQKLTHLTEITGVAERMGLRPFYS